MVGIDLNRRAALLGAAALSLAGPVRAGAATMATDRLGRMTLQVFINERGPFRFALDSAATMSMIADDLEMYHDKGGVVATSADQFMADYEKGCAARSAP